MERVLDSKAIADPYSLVRLLHLMARTAGTPEVRIGLIDGPVDRNHPDLAGLRVKALSGATPCRIPQSIACMHGSFTAGILGAARSGPVPGIAPACTLLVRTIFSEAAPGMNEMPVASEDELARAIVETVDAGASVINLSVGLTSSSTQGRRFLSQGVDYAARKGVPLVAASGNYRSMGGTAITSHPWVIPVVSCDSAGRPAHYSNLGPSIARRGLSAPGEAIRGLGPNGTYITLSGTSVAAPFVTGTIALLISEFPHAPPQSIVHALSPGRSRRSLSFPPLLDAAAGFQILNSIFHRENVA